MYFEEKAEGEPPEEPYWQFENLGPHVCRWLVDMDHGVCMQDYSYVVLPRGDSNENS